MSISTENTHSEVEYIPHPENTHWLAPYPENDHWAEARRSPGLDNVHWVGSYSPNPEDVQWVVGRHSPSYEDARLIPERDGRQPEMNGFDYERGWDGYQGSYLHP